MNEKLSQRKSSLRHIERSFFRCIRPMILVCQCFCAAPLHLSTRAFYFRETNTKQSPISALFLSSIHYLWSFIWLGAIIVSDYFQFHNFDTLEITLLTRFLYLCQYILAVISCFLIIVGCHYQRQQYINYFGRFVKIFQRLKEFGIQIPFNNWRRFILSTFAAYFAILVCVIFTDVMYNKQSVKDASRSSTVYVLPNIISVLALTQYILLLIILADCYRSVRHAVTTLSHPFMKKNDSLLISDNRRLLTMFCYQKSVDRSIDELRLICLDIGELLQDVNASFGLLLICTFVAVFIILNTQFYEFFIFIDHLQPINPWLILYCTLWTIIHGGKIFFILLFNHFVCEQVSKLCVFSLIFLI